MSGTLAVRQADVGDALNDMWRSVLLFIPRAIAFIAILVIGWIVARSVLKIVDAVLERVGFDRLVERGGVGRAMARTKYDASDILAKLAYYAVLLFTLQIAFNVWGPNAISSLISAVISWLPRAFVAVIIVVVAAAIANAVRELITGALGGMSYGRIVADAAAIFVLALGVIAALNQVGIATTVTTPVLIAVLATVAGILIIGVGGGLVKPMQERWEGWLQRAATETQAIRQQAQARGRGDTERQMAERQAAQRAGAMAGSHPPGAPGQGAPPRGMPGEQGQGVYQSGSAAGGERAMRGDDTRHIDPRDMGNR